MLFGLDLKGKTVLEPSAGKGDIVEVLKQYGANVLICENSEDLAVISSQKADRFLKSDFLEVSKEEVSHIDYIISNPPFSKDTEHIQHMWDIAPDGCTIIALCNSETIKNTYSVKRSQLKSIINENGSHEYLGDCFSNAERKTGVEVSLVKLYKPKSKGEDEFEGYFDLSEEYQEQGEGLMQHNEILELVNRYVGAVKMFDEVDEAQKRLNSLISPISHYNHKIEFKAVYSDSNKRYSDITREVFKKELQKGAWKSVFQKFDMERFVTQSVLSKINKFVEQQTHIPFTVKNIYKMVEVITGTHNNTMKQVIIEVFDWLTEHHKENRKSLEGWKTNSEYIVNRKFIAPYCGVSFGSYGNPTISWSSSGNRMDDLNKAICWLTGTKYDKNKTIENFFGYGGENVEYEKVDPDCEKEEGFEYLEEKYIVDDRNYKRHTVHNLFKYKEEDEYLYKLSTGYNKGVVRYKMFGKWYDWGFFKIKVFKKGTLHAEFKDKKVWDCLIRKQQKLKDLNLLQNLRVIIVKNQQE
jgi:hypothetical protein